MRAVIDVDELAAAVRGPVLLDGDEGMAAEVAGFNLAIPQRPALAVGATCAEDVAGAVRWAAARGLPVTVLTTGHGVASSAEDAVLVSTRRMAGVTVDPVARVARINAGTVWADVVAAAAPHGLAPLNGSSPGVGAIGYTLGGGIPVFGRTFGNAADRIRAAEIVTADGRLRHVDAESEPELLWALRGGKGNLGIVTALEVELVELPSFYGGCVFFPGEAAPVLLHAWREWTATVPETMTSAITLLRMPPMPGVPEPLAGTLAVQLVVAFAGDAAEGERLLAPLRAAAPVLMDLIAEKPYTDVGSVFMDPTDPMPSWDLGRGLRELPAEAVNALLAAAGPGRDVPLVITQLRHLGGALARPSGPGAVAGRDAAYLLVTIGAMVPPLAEVVPAAGLGVHAALAPWAGAGCPLNFIGAHRTPEEVAAAWAPADAARLRAVKAAVDPDNVFRVGAVVTPLGASIPPQAGPGEG